MGWEYKFTNEIPQGKVGSILYFFLKQKRIKDLERVTGYNSLRAHFETTEDSTASRIAAYVSMDIFSLWNPLFLLSVVIEKGGKEHTKPWKKTASPTPPPQTSKYFKKKKKRILYGTFQQHKENLHTKHQVYAYSPRASLFQWKCHFTNVISSF